MENNIQYYIYIFCISFGVVIPMYILTCDCAGAHKQQFGKYYQVM